MKPPELSCDLLPRAVCQSSLLSAMRESTFLFCVWQLELCLPGRGHQRLCQQTCALQLLAGGMRHVSELLRSCMLGRALNSQLTWRDRCVRAEGGCSQQQQVDGNDWLLRSLCQGLLWVLCSKYPDDTVVLAAQPELVANACRGPFWR